MQNKSRHIFAVCDVEVEYAYNFMEYLNRKRSLPFEVQAFTGPEILCEFAGKHPIEILLISDKAVTEEVRAAEGGKTDYLVGGSPQSGTGISIPACTNIRLLMTLSWEVMDCLRGGESARVGGGCV